MAIVKLGPIVQAASGTIGGVVFKNKAGGAIVQVKRRRAPAVTFDSLNQQKALAEINRVWGALGVSERVSWSVAAHQLNQRNRLGDRKHMTGRTLYFQTMGITYRAYGQALTTGPGPVNLVQVKTLYTIWEGGIEELYIDWQNRVGSLNVIMYGARSYSKSGWRRRIYKYITRRVISAASCFRDFSSEWCAVYPDLAHGEHFSLKLYVQQLGIGGVLWTGPIIFDDVADVGKPIPDPWPPS